MARPITPGLFILVRCLNCNTEIRSYKTHPRKHCSRKCRGEYVRKGQECANCGGPIKHPKSHKRKYCSIKCRGEYNRLNFGQALRNEALAGYKNHAQERGLCWELTEESVDRLFSSNCHWCGCEPANKRERERSYGFFIYSGIDRINNAVGYTESNVVSCCYVCNSMKRDFTAKVFIEKAKLIAAKFK